MAVFHRILGIAWPSSFLPSTASGSATSPGSSWRTFAGGRDLVFIDADKESYPAYLAWAAHHLKVGGLVIGDNCFAFGEIVDGRSAGAEALREFNKELAQGGRFRSTLLPTGEGLTVGVKVR